MSIQLLGEEKRSATIKHAPIKEHEPWKYANRKEKHVRRATKKGGSVVRTGSLG